MSRFLRAARTAQSLQAASKADPRVDADPEPRPFKVLSVTSNKGGVGKTTLACNLAVYLRALCEDLPILILTLDDQLVLDRMFSTDDRAPSLNLLDAVRSGDLASAIQLGQFGIHYVAASPDAAKLKAATADLFHLQRILERAGWRGLVILDTKSDFEILTQNAIMASDLVMVVVKDYASLLEAERVFDLLRVINRPQDIARITLSLMDLRVKFGAGPANVLELLVSEVRKRGYPLFETFVSRSAKVEALQTNPEACVHSIMHGASSSVTHRQMGMLAQEVWRILNRDRPAAEEAAPRRDSDLVSSPILRVGKTSRSEVLAS